MLGRRQEINLQLLEFVDFTILGLTFYTSYVIRAKLALWFFPHWDELGTFPEFYWLVAIIAPFTPILLEAQGFYKNPLGKPLRKTIWQLGGALVWIGLMIGFYEVFLR